MKRIILLIPLLGLTAFGGYYRHWDSELKSRLAVDARDPLARYARRDGGADAAEDIARGHRRLLTCGEPAAAEKEYHGLLNRIYRIEVESLTAAPPAAFLERYAADYNAVMTREIAATYGPDVLRHTQTMAERAHVLNVRIAQYTPPL